MHRSGTSCLTGTLESWGVNLGEVFTQNPSNAKGNRENREIMDLHDAVLATNGGSWDRPPQDVEWKWSHRVALHGIIRGFEDQPCWGFKDPRSLFTLNYWQELVPQMEFVGIFRSPIAVARSLHARDKVRFPSLKEGIELWTAHNRRLLEIHDRKAFPILCFDEPSEQFAAKLETVRQKLGFPEPTMGASFFTDELRHQQGGPEEELPEEAAKLYARLQSLAL